jgi:hypothetical protein
MKREEEEEEEEEGRGAETVSDTTRNIAPHNTAATHSEHSER